MLIVCPSCKAKLNVLEPKSGAVEFKLRCGNCRKLFKVARKGPRPVDTQPTNARLPLPGERIKVVVAQESPVFCSAVMKVLASEPFDVFAYHDGLQALAAIEEIKPHVVLLDVALPSMHGFEVCETVRKNPALSSIKLILIASIFDKTRYKRSPSSLYGADAYMEKHHIPDSLAATINRLVSGEEPADFPGGGEAPLGDEVAVLSPGGSPREQSDQESTCQALREDERRVTLSSGPPSPPDLSEAHVKARRLARIIVSDIVLYNQAKVEEGIRNNNFYRLLAEDIQEGKALYDRRVPEEIRNSSAYLREAFEELISKKKWEFDPGRQEDVAPALQY